MGYVGQDSLVFDATIFENINVGLDNSTTVEQFDSLLERVNASDFYNKDNQELVNKKLGLKGSNVSGGQRQRIAIARALARNALKPKLVILDEATASLDGKNEEEIQKIINKILEDKNCTIIVIAHRLSTIRNADVINVLADGELRERGSHTELMAIKGGLYKGMVNI